MGLVSSWQYLKWCTYHHPVIVASFALSFAGPLLLGVVYPLRREYGYKRPVDAPRSYKFPDRERAATVGYDD
ncbi:uncharacterized protein BJ171DRAFT_487501 [Polychytrium aggregatum]|uniref:uncharacterized protein n=1 Tax=Polychytrium aggregatum TaxID=110093 RepID=UPI0022FEED49|nr:uncharacterized protein BJ171DRAFT_487501 [Polychytrium aggregatum]KAI9208853.1 hypothetical protein BJ171DRAFT_487501 [Polychytrium aggregatum]